MTTQRTFKRQIRARMEKTGESYTAARRVILDREWERPVSEQALVKAVGHGWAHWLGVLDAWGGTGHTHTEIARWLVAEHAVPGWWAQTITLGYERARGMRAPLEHTDGFSISATKTVNVPVERLFAAWTEHAAGEPRLRVRTATAPKSARYDWEDGATRVNVGFTSKSESKSVVALAHERLPDADTASELKALWRERLQMLKSMLEA